MAFIKCPTDDCPNYMDDKELIAKLERFRGNFTAQKYFQGKEINVCFENEFISDVVVKTSNKSGGESFPKGKMWSIVFKRNKEFGSLPQYRLLRQELQKIVSNLDVTPDRSGVRSHGLRIYCMSENPTAEIVIDILNFIFGKDENRSKSADGNNSKDTKIT